MTKDATAQTLLYGASNPRLPMTTRQELWSEAVVRARSEGVVLVDPGPLPACPECGGGSVARMCPWCSLGVISRWHPRWVRVSKGHYKALIAFPGRPRRRGRATMLVSEVVVASPMAGTWVAHVAVCGERFVAPTRREAKAWAEHHVGSMGLTLTEGEQ